MPSSSSTSGEVAGAGPALTHGFLDDVQGGVADLAAEHVADQVRLGVSLDGGVRGDAPQGRLGPQQPATASSCSPSVPFSARLRAVRARLSSVALASAEAPRSIRRPRPARSRAGRRAGRRLGTPRACRGRPGSGRPRRLLRSSSSRLSPTIRPARRGRERADLRAQGGHGLLPLGGDLGVRAVDDARLLALALLAHLGHDGGALLARLLADPRRLVAGVGDLRLELRLGGVGVGPRLLEVGELLADRLLAVGHRLVDRRDDVARQQEEEQPERGELDQERAVGHEEVALHRDELTREARCGACHVSVLCLVVLVPEPVVEIRTGRRRTSP